MCSPLLQLASLYSAPERSGREPEFTTWKFRPAGEVCHTIDYVWYTPGALRAIARCARGRRAGAFGHAAWTMALAAVH